MKDRYQREIDYLRVSITDRCNFQCTYCYPTVGRVLLPADEILSYEEIIKVAQAAVHLGINKFRVTGGEPLVRRDVMWFLRQLMVLPGVRKVALTTNGYLLGEYAGELAKIKPHSINIGLNSLKPDVFKSITGADGSELVWKGIIKLIGLGYHNIKINTVLLKGINDNEVLDFAQLTRDYPLTVRFIEYMPCGDWAENKSSIILGDDIKRIITTELGALEPVKTDSNSGPAEYYRLGNSQGRLGFILPVSMPFCESCNRLRLTADGHLKSCLLSADEIDVKSILRVKPPSGKALQEAVRQAILNKPQRHAAQRNNVMSRIGG